MLAIGIALLVVDGGVGALSPVAVLVAIGTTLLVAMGAVGIMLWRRRTIVDAIMATGRLDGALWSAGVQQTSGDPEAVSGLNGHDPAGTWPPPRECSPSCRERCCSCPDLRVIRHGNQPWAVPVGAVTGSEAIFGAMNRVGGGHLYLGLHDSSVLESVGDARGLTHACYTVGIPFAGAAAPSEAGRAEHMNAAAELRLLGPLDVVNGERFVPLTAGKQRKAFAALLVIARSGSTSGSTGCWTVTQPMTRQDYWRAGPLPGGCR